MYGHYSTLWVWAHTDDDRHRQPGRGQSQAASTDVLEAVRTEAVLMFDIRVLHCAVDGALRRAALLEDLLCRWSEMGIIRSGDPFPSAHIDLRVLRIGPRVEEDGMAVAAGRHR